MMTPEERNIRRKMLAEEGRKAFEEICDAVEKFDLHLVPRGNRWCWLVSTVEEDQNRQNVIGEVTFDYPDVSPRWWRAMEWATKEKGRFATADDAVRFLAGIQKASATQATTEELQLLAERCYPDLKKSGICSHHQHDGHFDCTVCYPDWPGLCRGHVEVNHRLVEERDALAERLIELEEVGRRKGGRLYWTASGEPVASDQRERDE
jgi:hypothetical protein